MKSLVILGRRWHQKTYGNTYFSARAYIDGEQVVNITCEYGYGNHWLHETMDGLRKRGLILSSETPDTLRRCGVNVITDVVDVARKKDL